MPTYDYICENCGHEFEQFQSMTSKSLRRCPECKKLQLKRLIGAGAGVIFKGTGFYETDYRSKSYKDAREKEKTLKKETKSETKDSKPCKKDKSAAKSKKEQ